MLKTVEDLVSASKHRHSLRIAEDFYLHQGIMLSESLTFH